MDLMFGGEDRPQDLSPYPEPVVVVSRECLHLFDYPTGDHHGIWEHLLERLVVLTLRNFIRVFAISKLGWIKRQQKKLREQQRETPREYLDRESHYVWGQRYLLQVTEVDAAPAVELKHNKMLLRVRPGTSQDKKQTIVDEWYRARIKKAVPSLIAKCSRSWELRWTGSLCER